jgi:hypothetical protein
VNLCLSRVVEISELETCAMRIAGVSKLCQCHVLSILWSLVLSLSVPPAIRPLPSIMHLCVPHVLIVFRRGWKSTDPSEDIVPELSLAGPLKSRARQGTVEGGPTGTLRARNCAVTGTSGRYVEAQRDVVPDESWNS